eukprot:1148616-Pelagomonas_calceolata.AAC.4
MWGNSVPSAGWISTSIRTLLASVAWGWMDLKMGEAGGWYMRAPLWLRQRPSVWSSLPGQRACRRAWAI